MQRQIPTWLAIVIIAVVVVVIALVYAWLSRPRIPTVPGQPEGKVRPAPRGP
jgi:amino acid transporter